MLYEFKPRAAPGELFALCLMASVALLSVVLSLMASQLGKQSVAVFGVSWLVPALPVLAPLALAVYRLYCYRWRRIVVSSEALEFHHFFLRNVRQKFSWSEVKALEWVKPGRDELLLLVLDGGRRVKIATSVMGKNIPAWDQINAVGGFSVLTLPQALIAASGRSPQIVSVEQWRSQEDLGPKVTHVVLASLLALILILLLEYSTPAIYLHGVSLLCPLLLPSTAAMLLALAYLRGVRWEGALVAALLLGVMTSGMSYFIFLGWSLLPGHEETMVFRMQADGEMQQWQSVSHQPIETISLERDIRFHPGGRRSIRVNRGPFGIYSIRDDVAEELKRQP